MEVEEWRDLATDYHGSQLQALTAPILLANDLLKPRQLPHRQSLASSFDMVLSAEPITKANY